MSPKCFWCAIALVVFSAGAAPAEDLTKPLTAEQVTCDELQLERLARRFVVYEERSPSFSPSLFSWRSSWGATFGGLAITDGTRSEVGTQPEDPLRIEQQLSVDLTVRPVGDRLNPQRPLLPHATLARRTQDSSLVGPFESIRLNVTLDLAPAVPNPFVPGIPLLVSNVGQPFAGMSPLAVADAAGRGIAVDRLGESCHAELTPFDQKVFTLLARTLRISECFSRRGCDARIPDHYNVTLFRGSDPHVYRANVYLYDPYCDDDDTCYHFFGKVALELTVGWTAEGRLTAGTVRVLPDCSLPGSFAPGCSDYSIAEIGIYFLPPVWPGRERRDESEVRQAPNLQLSSPGIPTEVRSATIDWEALLAESAWNP